MKKKQITLLTCSAIAATLASVCLTNKETNINESDDLLALNIEALSSGDENGEIEGVSECPGPALYSDVGTQSGEATLRLHVNDSTDQIVVQAYKKCYAMGMGKTKGDDMAIIDISIKSTFESKCLGPKYHKTSIYDN